MLAQNGFERFLEQAIADGLLPFTDLDSIPPDVKEQAQEVFETFKTHMELIGQQQSLNTAVLVQLSNAKRDYVEHAPIGPAEMVRQARETGAPSRPPGISVSTPQPNGTARDYYFSYDDHPALMEAFGLEKKVKEHLYRDFYNLGRRVTPR